MKLVIFDFDGTFTDGIVTFDKDGCITKGYNVKDGMGIDLLKKAGIKVGVISGFQENNSTRAICNHLKIDYISIGSNDKITITQNWMDELKITFSDVAFMGDDINDLNLLKLVEIAGCPNDSASECLEVSKFVSKYSGGRGAVREFCEFVLKYRNIKKVSGLVCVKWNSRRCPMKNIRQFGNSTLLEIKLKKLLSLNFIDNVILNTESDIIINYISERIKDPRLIVVKRCIEFTLDDISNFAFCNAVTKGTHEYVLYSPVTMPFITEKTYNSMYEKINKMEYDSVVLIADGIQGTGHIEESHNYCFGASIMKRDDINSLGDFIGNKPYFQECNSRERIDIDTPEEFENALYHYYNPDAIYENKKNPLYLFSDTKISKLFENK